MTKSQKHRITEPLLPEHQLIRDCAPVHELSAGFKGRVMAECSVSMASAAKAWRWKVGTTTAVICALGLLICIVLPGGNDSSEPVLKQAKNLPPNTQQQYQLPSSSSQMAADMPKPPSTKKGSSGNDLLDGLNQRKQLFDANMLPSF
jgi:hypothetical protein